MIRTNYDPAADVMHIAFGPDGAASDGAQEVAPGVFVEFDPQGRPIGVEITSIRWRSENSTSLRPAAE